MTVITYTHAGGNTADRRTGRRAGEDGEILELVGNVLVEIEPSPTGVVVFRCTQDFDISPVDVGLLKVKLQELHVRTGYRWWMVVPPTVDLAMISCSQVVTQAPFLAQLERFAEMAEAGFELLSPRVSFLC